MGYIKTNLEKNSNLLAPNIKMQQIVYCLSNIRKTLFLPELSIKDQMI